MDDQHARDAAARAESDDGFSAYEVLNAGSEARFLLLCDHASHFIPRRYRGLGLDPATLERHIAWDIGAGDLTRRLVELMDAPAVMCRVSRLVIDCNRPPGDATSIVAVSDGIAVPGNCGVDPAEAELRRERYFRPYHAAIGRMIEGFAERGVVPAIVPIHTFTPVMNGYQRPWHVGVLWHRDGRLAGRLLRSLGQNPTLTVGDNEPYSGADPSSYTVQTYGRDRGRPHASLEIRQDLVDTPRGVESWSRIVAAALREALDDESLYRAAAPGRS